MPENTANDLKVRYKLGEGGAPPVASDQLIALHAEYKRAGDALTSIGLNGAMFVNLNCQKQSQPPSSSMTRPESTTLLTNV